jgi:hypothetical protein
MPEMALVSLARDCQYAQIRGVALNRVIHERVSSEILAELGDSQYEDVLLAVTQHPRVPLELLVSLMIDNEYAEVRKTASNRVIHEGTSPEILAELASSRYEDVLVEIARHPGTPSSCIPRLAEGLASVIRSNCCRQETRVERVRVEEEEYDDYYGYYRTGSHYEDRHVTVSVPDYKRINSLVASLPVELRTALRERSGDLATDPHIEWDSASNSGG